jgi:hypothetical protein
MTESMHGWCSTGRHHLHERSAIGYEKVQEGPTFESRGTNIALTAPARYRYFVVWVCQSCARTWWVEDFPNIAEATA